MRFLIKTALLLFIFLASASMLSAHMENEEHQKHASIWEKLNIPDPLNGIYAASVISGIAIIIALIFKNSFGNNAQKIVFSTIALPVVLATIYLSATTIYLNTVSETGGPVHWHADYQIWACGSRYQLIDPVGFDNRVGSAVLHEHNDDRIHVEGVLFKLNDAAIGRFFSEVGGKFTQTELTIPSEKGLRSWKNGESCNGTVAKLQMFVNGKKNTKMDEYVISPYSQVPPGDCIILEFDSEKEKTEKQCESYKER